MTTFNLRFEMIRSGPVAQERSGVENHKMPQVNEEKRSYLDVNKESQFMVSTIAPILTTLKV